MAENEQIKANLFGGYELGRDPWARGFIDSYAVPDTSKPTPLAPATPAVDVEALKKASTDYIAHKLAQKEATARANAQAALDRTELARQVQQQTRYAKCSVLQDVVYIIREVLDRAGVSVTLLPNNGTLQYNSIRSHLHFAVPQFDAPNFREQAAKQFLDEFLKNNPERRHMFNIKQDLPQGVDLARYFEHNGLSLRAIVDYHISDDEFHVYVDCLYAIATEENLLLCPTTQTGAGQIQGG